MRQQILLAWPLPKKDAHERTWEKWRNAFRIAWERQGGKSFGSDHVGILAKVYSSGGPSGQNHTRVPVYLSDELQGSLQAVGAIEGDHSVKSVTFTVEEAKKPFNVGNIVLTIETMRR